MSEPSISAEEPLQCNKTSETKKLLALALGALGVVYGDIGTSPLYAIKECFHKEHGILPTHDNILGILSLIFWALIFIVSIKYLMFVMKADNRGEGGIISLLSLVIPSGDSSKYSKYIFSLIIIGLFGTALLLSDGVITPAISVLSAVEGLGVATHVFSPYIVPITIAILIGLFLIQKRGTGKIGAIFGPMMICWFIIIAFLGIIWIIKAPKVLSAVYPIYAFKFFLVNKLHGFLILGAVVLCITGGEALYADMGHFGKQPIRIAWFFLVCPALMLNYFGQGAAVLLYPEKAITNPFYFLAPKWFLYPMVFIATCATIIASQALISGSFSLAQQAMQMGYVQRLKIVHTSSEMHGQIYIPEVNTALMISCLFLVLIFKTSSNLAAAYGIAVMGTMTITTILLFAVQIHKWRWSMTKAIAITSLFLCVDLPFLFANITKIIHGGWFPIIMGIGIFSIMVTWKRGRAELGKRIMAGFIPLEFLLNDISTSSSKPVRVKGTALFMTSNPGVVPLVLLHHLKHNKVLHEMVILLSIISEKIPKVSTSDKVQIKKLEHGFYQITAHFGFMESPKVPEILEICKHQGLEIDINSTTFFLGRESLLITGKSTMAKWRKSLFAFLSRNARPATAFFDIPPNRVVELGMQIEL